MHKYKLSKIADIVAGTADDLTKWYKICRLMNDENPLYAVSTLVDKIMNGGDIGLINEKIIKAAHTFVAEIEDIPADKIYNETKVPFITSSEFVDMDYKYNLVASYSDVNGHFCAYGINVRDMVEAHLVEPADMIFSDKTMIYRLLTHSERIDRIPQPVLKVIDIITAAGDVYTYTCSNPADPLTAEYLLFVKNKYVIKLTGSSKFIRGGTDGLPTMKIKFDDPDINKVQDFITDPGGYEYEL